MAKTYIGIDVDSNLLRVVALEESGSDLKTVAIVQRDLKSADETAEVIATILGEWDTTNARMAIALSAGSVLTRQLTFPFGDRKKIAAAVPLELGARLPIDLSNHFISSLPPVPFEGKFSTIGLALPLDLIQSTVAPFDEQQLPLRHVGIAPFAYISRLKEQPEDCLLIEIRQHEISTLLVQAGEPVSYRTFARNTVISAVDTVEQVRRDVMSLQKSTGLENLPILLVGPGLDSDLQKLITAALPNTSIPKEVFEDDEMPVQFLPALALARLAAAQGSNSFNLRQGQFAFRGSLAPFRKQLIAAALLLTLTLVALIGGSWLSYARKAVAADKLQTQLAAIYLDVFPGKKVPKDIKSDMLSRLSEARRQSQILGGPVSAPLPTLEAVTRAMPTNTETFVKELNYDKDGVRLAGWAKSFDEVDQLAAGLKSEVIFADARISDAKMSVDGKRVDFRIEVSFAEQGVQQ